MFSRRKNSEDLRQALEAIVIPVFCSAYSGVEPEKQQKLIKVDMAVKISCTIFNVILFVFFM